MGHLSPREFHEGNLEGGLHYWAPQRLSKALETGVCFHRDPAFGGKWRDAPFLGPLREETNSIFMDIFKEEFERYE